MKNINKQLIEQTKILLKGQQADSYFIWKSMEDQEQTETSNVYYYCMKLFESLIHTQKKIDNSEHQEAIFSTLLVLQFYKNMKEKNQSFRTGARELFSQTHMKYYQHAQWVMGLFLKNSEESLFARQFISRLCHAPKKLSWQIQPGRQLEDTIQEAEIYCRQLSLQKLKQQKFQKPLKYTSYPSSFVQSRIISLGYICFIDYLRSGNLQVEKDLYIHALDLLKGFVHAARITQKINELLINLMFLMKNLLTFYGCCFDNILKETAYWLNIVRNWAGVISHYASELLQIVHGQLKCKGTAFRKKLKMDFPSLDIKVSDALSKKVIVLTNLPAFLNSSPSCSITNLRKLVIYNLLACCEPQTLEKYWNNLKNIDAQVTYLIYFKLSKLIQLTMSLQAYSEIQGLQKQSIPQLFKTNILAMGKVTKDQIQELQQILNHQHQLKYFTYPVCQIIHAKIENFQNKKYLNSIYQLFENVRLPISELFYLNKVSLAIIGEDCEISQWMKSIIPYLEDLNTFLVQKLEIYLIPTKGAQCSIASYLALKDLWYRRFVYNVFHQKIFYPDTDIKENQMDKFPQYLMNKSAQMYIRESERIFPIQVYKCIIKFGDNGVQQQIYFSSHILIGTSAQISRLSKNKQQNKKKQQISNDYIDNLKKTKSESFLINIQVKYKQNSNLINKIQKNLSVEDIQICNLPRQYFMGNSPNPTTLNLQLSILTDKMGKVWRNQLQNSDIFKRNSQHQIRQIFKDLFTNLSAEFIKIQSINHSQPLKVVVDGAALNRVDKITIIPVFNQEKYPIRLPIKTFLPFQI